MTKILMVRHGKAAAGWDGSHDPGLDALGQSQAQALVGAIENIMGSIKASIITSPLLRCQETARPLAEKWGIEPVIDVRVRELPSPTEDLSRRTLWLKRVMRGSWHDLQTDPESAGVDYSIWKNGILDALKEHNDQEFIVIISHFIAINVVYGATQKSDAVVGFMPDNCSISQFEYDGQSIQCLDLGDEAKTVVN